MSVSETPILGRTWRLLACAATGVALRLTPVPDGVDPKGWTTLAVFVAIILGFVLQPMPMGALVVVVLVTLLATGTLDSHEALAGYGDHTVWLVIAAFLLAGALIESGLGRRIALGMVVRLGKTTLGLGYSLSAADLVLAPVIPSNTARGGGVLAPIMRALAEALDSHPDHQPRRAGAFLAMAGSQATVTTSAMFVTAMAANGLVVKAAKDIANVEFGFAKWAIGAIVPGLVALLVIPYVLYRIYPPEVRASGPARDEAKRSLKAMGPMKREERWLAGTLTGLLILWSAKPLFAMWPATELLSKWDATGVAWIGLAVLLLVRAAKWEQMAKNHQAWDALVWLGGLLTMAGALLNFGVVGWVASTVETGVAGFSPLLALVVLAVVYFLSMYLFSMLTAHITAMVGAFLLVAVTAGAPPLLAVGLLAYFSNLCACLTHYSTGPVIVYFGHGYVSAKQWLQMGALVGAIQLAIWLSVGLAWWKLLGWW